ncbi:cache domain-containing protein [Peptococcaceae bacterium 1198_IL3148]
MNKGVGFKLITIVCLSMLLLGSINIYINYSRELELDYQEKYQEFDLVADVIENDIQRWLNCRENEVILMSKDPLLQQYINALGTANEGALAAKQRQYWLDMQTQYGSYDEIYLITASGHIMLSTDQSRIDTARPVDDLVKLPLSTGSICFQDAYYSLKNNQHSIAFSIPVINWAQPYWVEYAGVLVCRINIDEVVNPLLNSRMNLGETGDVILIDKERAVLTGLRNQIDSARHVKLNSELVTKVSRGEEGTWRGIGYNGKEIIAVY